MNRKILEYVENKEKDLEDIFKNIDNIEFINSKKVLDAFINNNIDEACFNTTTGYGYNDIGRDKIEKVFSTVLNTEDALVRSQFISGSHALTVCFFALLRPNDILVSITGKPYDTLDEVIGIRDNLSSLKSFNINYHQIDLINDDFDYDKIKNYILNHKVKVIEIQRSRGYSMRKSITIDKLKKVIDFIKKIDSDIIIMVDDCYCEFVNCLSPSDVGADISVGSLIKNLGGAIASSGAYIAGKKDLVKLCSERLNLPGEAKDVGPSMNFNKEFLMGLYNAPRVVADALKLNVLTSYVLSSLGYNTSPKYNEEKADIVLMITFNNKDKLIDYVRSIQNSSPIDSASVVVASNMPGYEDEIIMASGSFTQGSSIELSCDGPLKEPYNGFMQGAFSYSYGKIALVRAIEKLSLEVFKWKV